MFYDLLIKRRTIRLFKQKKVPLEVIKKAVNAARLAPSAANLQFLEYLVVTDKKIKDKVFSCTRWAGYIRPKRTPPPKKQPTVYVIILANKQKSKEYDLRDIGAAAQNMILAFLSYGVGSCWIAALDRKLLRKILNIPAKYEIDSLVAAGFAQEAPKLETDSKNIKYWLDKNNRLHVPKRPLSSIAHYNKIKQG